MLYNKTPKVTILCNKLSQNFEANQSECKVMLRLCLIFISFFPSRTAPSKSQAVAATVNRPLPHYKLGDLGIVPRSHPKLGERTRTSSPLAPIGKPTRSVGVQTTSAQKVSQRQRSCR